MHEINESFFRPYFRKVFTWFIFTFLIITLIGNAAIYFVRTQRFFKETQNDLKQVAINVAAKITVDIHEKLINPEQQSTADYILIEDLLQAVQSGNLKLDDIYTLRPTDRPHLMAFVVSAKDTNDSDQDGYIEESEMKAMLGEEYDTSELPDLEAGLSGPAVDREVTYDKWGEWLSGYAPLKDGTGKTVAVVGVDMNAQLINEQRNELIKSILYSDLFLLPFLILIAILLARHLSRPFRILAQGLYRLSHGDLAYRLPLKGKGESNIFVDLFNRIVTLIDGIQKEKTNKEK